MQEKGPEQSPEERRQFKRVEKNLFVQCRPHDTTGSWRSIRIREISERGMSFFTKEQFAVGTTLEIKLITFIRRHPIVILGKIVGQEQSKGNIWIMRASIVQINQEDKPVYEELMQIFLKGTEGG